MAFDLASISKSGGLKPPIALLYGVPGVAKTTFCAGAPNVIFALTEDGMGSNRAPHFPQLQSFSDILQIIDTLGSQEHNYQWLAIDSLSALETLIFNAVCAENNVPTIETLGYGKGYLQALDKWEQLLSWLTALRDRRNMGILLVCHAEVLTFKNPEGDDYDRYQIDLDKRAMKLFRKYCDLIGFMNYKVVIKKESAKDTKGKAINNKMRVIHFNEKPAYIAKNRYNLPDSVELPDLSSERNQEVVAKKNWQVFGELLEQAIAADNAAEQAA
jgi:AAA domain